MTPSGGTATVTRARTTTARTHATPTTMPANTVTRPRVTIHEIVRGRCLRPPIATALKTQLPINPTRPVAAVAATNRPPTFTSASWFQTT